MHDALTIGVPVLAILFGILVNQRNSDKLDARIDKMETALNARIERVQAELTGQINNLSARVDRIQADLIQFYRT